MNIEPLRQWLADAIAVLRILPSSVASGFDEMRWSRSVAFVPGPTSVSYAVECAPKPHAELWPMKLIVHDDVIPPACEGTMRAVAALLDAPLPAGVTRLKGKVKVNK